MRATGASKTRLETKIVMKILTVSRIGKPRTPRAVGFAEAWRCAFKSSMVGSLNIRSHLILIPVTERAPIQQPRGAA
jgi:hypothetical protein